MTEIVFVIVVFFGTNPVGVLLDKTEFRTIKECLDVAAPIQSIASVEEPAKGFCISKEKVTVTKS